MTSIANAIISYGLLKYPRPNSSYPVGAMFIASACVDIIIAVIISIGL
jgi:hypothetical protein